MFEQFNVGASGYGERGGWPPSPQKSMQNIRNHRNQERTNNKYSKHIYSIYLNEPTHRSDTILKFINQFQTIRQSPARLNVSVSGSSRLIGTQLLTLFYMYTYNIRRFDLFIFTNDSCSFTFTICK